MTDQPDDATSRIPTPGGAGVPGASPADPRLRDAGHQLAPGLALVLIAIGAWVVLGAARRRTP